MLFSSILKKYRLFSDAIQDLAGRQENPLADKVASPAAVETAASGK
jgi:hypothetical protein